MNLLEKIKSLHLDKMVVTNSELSFFYTIQVTPCHTTKKLKLLSKSA